MEFKTSHAIVEFFKRLTNDQMVLVVESVTHRLGFTAHDRAECYGVFFWEGPLPQSRGEGLAKFMMNFGMSFSELKDAVLEIDQSHGSGLAAMLLTQVKDYSTPLAMVLLPHVRGDEEHIFNNMHRLCDWCEENLSKDHPVFGKALELVAKAEMST